MATYVNRTGTRTRTRIQNGQTYRYSFSAPLVTGYTDGIKRKKPRGFKPPTPYSKVMTWHFARDRFEYTYNKSDGSLAYVESGYLDNTLAYPTSELSHFSDNALNALRLSALQKVVGRDIDLGVILGEIPETMRMVKDIAEKSINTYLLIKRRKWAELNRYLFSSERRSVVTNASSAYLAWQFGILPTMAAVEDSIAFVQSGLSDARYTVRATKREPLPRFVGNGRTVSRCNGYRMAQVNMTFRPQLSNLRFLDQSGLLNIPAIIWETAPLSFVVDWAVPVGAWLSQWTLPFTATFLGGSQTKFIKATLTGHRADLNSSFYRQSLSGGSGVKHIDLQRTVLTSPYVPYPPLPDFSLEHGQMISSLALLQQFTRRR